MMKKGKMTVTSGYDVPVDAPLYNKPPIYYKDTESINFSYVTDDGAVADILPEGLEVPEVPVATLMFVHYHFSTLGPYLETILGVNCVFKKQTYLYIPYLMVDTDMPLAAGREIWGFAKKLAHITLEKEGDLITGIMERPQGNRICTGIMRPEKPVSPAPAGADGGSGGCLSLRVIPSADGNPKPALAELILTPSVSTPIQAFEGPGFVEFNSTSIFDPWYKLAVKKVVSCAYRRYDMVLHAGKIVKTY